MCVSAALGIAKVAKRGPNVIDRAWLNAPDAHALATSAPNVATASRWQFHEPQDATDGRRWCLQPPHRSVPAQLQVGEERCMGFEPAPIRRAFGQDQHGNRGGALPAHRCGNPERKTPFHVEGREQSLHIDDRRLDLDSQHNAKARMEREQIDAAALAEMIEGDLRSPDPSEPLEQ
jgi:hypothetical protein